MRDFKNDYLVVRREGDSQVETSIEVMNESNDSLVVTSLRDKSRDLIDPTMFQVTKKKLQNVRCIEVTINERLSYQIFRKSDLQK